LDRTAFYPTSGGQPHDAGTLSGVPVVDVVDADDTVIHVVDGAPASLPIAAGAQVEGIVDWERRFDHMQQHTGQHVLSAVFEELFGLKTVGFHLGAESATIDLEGGNVDAAIAQKAE